MILLHEIGHYYHGDHLISKNRDEEREMLVLKGAVSDEELKADLFAAEYLGAETVVEGLRVLIKKRKEECSEDEEEGDVGLDELVMRLEAIQNL